MIWNGWEKQLLQALGIVPNAERVKFLAAWAACEGGTAKWNPLNTTQHVARSTSYNSVGVQHYPSQAYGLAATLLTLDNGFYRDILRQLRAPGLTALQIAQGCKRGLSTWGTGSTCIVLRLRGT